MADDTLTPEERNLLFKQWIARRAGVKTPEREALDDLLAEDALESLREQALTDLRTAIAQETDPPTKAHLERKLKLMDPELRDACIKTLGPVIEPDASVDPDATMLESMKRGLTMDQLMGRAPKSARPGTNEPD